MGRITNKCVLIADDDARNLLALDALLQPYGHRIVQARSGREAIRRFEEVAPDVVLCDLVMPDLDGIEVLRMIREHAERGDTPFVLVTGHAEREHRLRALQAGADEFLEKPIDEAVLAARLTSLLRRKDARDELAARHAALLAAQREQRELMEFLVRDVREPIARLRTAVGDMDELGDLDPRIAEPLGRMRRAAAFVDATLQDLLWVSMLESSALPVRRVTIAVNEVIDEVVDHYTPLAAQRSVDLRVHCAERVAVPADRRLVQRVVENLLDNALRYTPVGGRVQVELRRSEGADIRVCNDGPAIAAEDRERIFAKFARAAMEPERPGHGGLGLYFCKCAIEALQGDICVDDVAGWATSFHVWLPGVRDPFTTSLR